MPKSGTIIIIEIYATFFNISNMQKMSFFVKVLKIPFWKL